MRAIFASALVVTVLWFTYVLSFDHLIVVLWKEKKNVMHKDMFSVLLLKSLRPLS